MTVPSNSHEGALPLGAETLADFGEKCAVFGVYHPNTDVAETTYQGLVMLKHRGQDASGIAVAGKDGISLYKDLGSVKDVFELGHKLKEVLPSIGRIAIGHNRYGTQKKLMQELRLRAAQPIRGKGFVAAINGDISNIHPVMQNHGFGREDYVSDTDGAVKLLSSYIGTPGIPSLRPALRSVLPQLEGAFSAIFTDGENLIGARDRHGFRPYVYGRTAMGGHILSSEVRGLHGVGAEFEREIDPGEIVTINERGVFSEAFAEENTKLCMYEDIYFSKEENIFHGQKVGDVRNRLGQELANEHPMMADIVVGVPNSGITAAKAYAEALNLKYAQVIEKNANKEADLRSFLANCQDEREAIARAKVVIDRLGVEGKSVLVVDDSVIRGTVSKVVIQMIREAGATEVHVRVPAPMYKFACHYGMDTGRPEELLATNRTPDEMRDFIGADSLEFLSLAGVGRARRRNISSICGACATGEYPTEVSLLRDASVPVSLIR